MLFPFTMREEIYPYKYSIILNNSAESKNNSTLSLINLSQTCLSFSISSSILFLSFLLDILLFPFELNRIINPLFIPPPLRIFSSWSTLFSLLYPFFHTLSTHLQLSTRAPFPLIFSIAVKYSSYTHLSLSSSIISTNTPPLINIFSSILSPLIFLSPSLRNENLPRGKPCISRGKRGSQRSLSLFLSRESSEAYCG